MTGTFVNVAGIIVGSLIGLILKRGIPEHVNAAVLKIEGLVVALIGLGGVLTSMISVDSVAGKIDTSGGILLLVSLVMGCVCGEFLKIDDNVNRFGLWIENKFKTADFARGFVTASLLFSIGAMSVIGPMNDGLTGDASLLYIKTILDGTTSILLASVFGAGVFFSFIPVLILQSIPALLASRLAPFLSDALLSDFCMVGYTIVICIGLNFLFDVKIKVANLLPALLIPIIWYFVSPLIQLPF